jgi:hypothetical protein
MTVVEASGPKGNPVNIPIRALCAAALTVVVTAGPAVQIAHANGDLNCSNFRFREDAEAEFNRNLRDPHRLDEDRGRDDNIVCEFLPRRGTAVAVVPPVAVLPTVTPLPTLGVRGGLGGSTGPAGFEVALGAGMAVGALGLTAGYVVHRRRRVRS